MISRIFCRPISETALRTSCTSEPECPAIAAELAREKSPELPPWPICPQCCQKLNNKGQSQRRAETEAGEIEVERTYFYYSPSRRGLFPLNERWQLRSSVNIQAPAQTDGLAGQPLAPRNDGARL